MSIDEQTQAVKHPEDSFLASFVESIQDGLFGLDRNWRFIYVNQKAAQNVGYTPEQLLGKNIWETFPGILATGQEVAYRQVMQQRQFTHFELKGVLTPCWYDVRVYPFSEGITVYWLDITPQKQFEARLNESERKYRDLVQNSTAAIYEIDFRSRRFVSVNDAMCLLSGYSREELLEMDASSIIDADSRRRFQQRVAVAQTGGELDENVEYVVRARDGREIFAVLNATFLKDEHGRITGATVIGHDITQRKRAELALQAAHATLQRQAEELECQTEELQNQASELLAANEKLQENELKLRNFNALLEQSVAERTQALLTANEELNVAQETLRTQNEELEKGLVREKSLRMQLIQSEKFAALARLVGSVAHEINNPLQNIKNCLFLLQSETDAQGRAGMLDLAASETRRIAELVVQLRQTYRPGNLQLVDFNLADVLTRVMMLLGPQFKQNRVQWQVLTPPDCIILHGIPDQLQQVCLNICLNAIEAMGPSGGRLDVTVTLPPGRKSVRLAFHDSGPGIAKQHLNQIFEPFFTTKEKGTGLGLAISYEIIKNHGGEINVESEPGNGATFTVTLPLAG